MDEYMLNDLYWVYDLSSKRLSVFIKNSSNTRVKNLASGAVYDIPKYHGDYGFETRLDFDRILNSSCIVYRFDEFYGIVGTNAFATLKKEAKQVEKETNRMNKDTKNIYYAYEMPTINAFQYMSVSDIVEATRRAEPILKQNESVKRREREVNNRSNLNF